MYDQDLLKRIRVESLFVVPRHPPNGESNHIANPNPKSRHEACEGAVFHGPVGILDQTAIAETQSVRRSS
jgi:hypothetical protein